MPRSERRSRSGVTVAALLLAACGGKTSVHQGASDGGGGPSGGQTQTGGNSGGPVSGTGGATVARSPIGVCSDPQTGGGNWTTCREGFQHRSTLGVCPTSVPRAGSGARPDASTAECQSDADCAYLLYGQCGYDSSVADFRCSAGCTTDGDCASGQVCFCGDSVGYCIEAGCKVDGDCGSGSFCATYLAGSCAPAISGVACQSESDDCVGNECSCARPGDQRGCAGPPEGSGCPL